MKTFKVVKKQTLFCATGIVNFVVGDIYTEDDLEEMAVSAYALVNAGTIIEC